MEANLNAHEARVLGVLVEKAFTTPEQYPLSLNAATNGCNQKSNRHPVVDFSEAEVTVALQGLQFKHLVGSSTPSGSRVEKYRHNAGQHLSVGDRELAVLAELLLRGPQTPGELRARATRMCTIASLDELEIALQKLIDKGYVQRLPPEPGSRAERFGQLLAAGLHPDAAPGHEPRAEAPARAVAPPTSLAPAGSPLADRVAALEHDVARLRAQLRGLAVKLGEVLEG